MHDKLEPGRPLISGSYLEGRRDVLKGNPKLGVYRWDYRQWREGIEEDNNFWLMFMPLPKFAGALGKLAEAGGEAERMSTVATMGGVDAVVQVAVHGNSLKSLRPTWRYKLYSADGSFLKNGITSKLIPESRYTKAFMSDKYMVPFKQFPNRLEAYQWEFQQNQILRGPLNLNMH